MEELNYNEEEKQPISEERSCLPMVVVGVVAGAVLAATTSFLLLAVNQETKDDLQPSYQDGYDQAMADAEERLRKRGLILSELPPSDTDIQQYAGEVVSVSPNALTVEYLPANPLEAATTKTFDITRSTKVIRMVEKDRELYRTELESWEATLGTASDIDIDSPSIPPQPFLFETITVADVPKGATVSVTVEDAELTVVLLQSLPIENGLLDPQ